MCFFTIKTINQALHAVKSRLCDVRYFACHSSLCSSARDRHKMMIPSSSEDGLALVACYVIMGQKRDLGKKWISFLLREKARFAAGGKTWTMNTSLVVGSPWLATK